MIASFDLGIGFVFERQGAHSFANALPLERRPKEGAREDGEEQEKRDERVNAHPANFLENIFDHIIWK
jgi:hypothetical protein